MVGSLDNQNRSVQTWSNSRPMLQELKRRISAAIWGWDCPLLTFIYPVFIVGSLGAASKVGAMLLDLILWWGHLIIKTDRYRNGRIRRHMLRELKRRISAAIWGWDCPLLTFIYPVFIVGSLGAASKVGAMLLDLILWWGHLIIKTDRYRNGRIPDPCFRN